MKKEMLQVKDLKTYYKTRNNESVYAVDGVSFTLEEGKVLGVAGESGCGKSTLALSLMGLFAPPLYYKSGSILVNGQSITDTPKEQLRTKLLGRQISYIPQAAMNVLNPTLKIKHFIEDIMEDHRPELSRKQVYELAALRFETLNLSKKVLESFPTELSGGMKQRTVIAISTILNPEVLIADEPTSALDVTSQKSVIRLIKDLMERGFIKSLVFITHELPLLYHVADDIMVMYAGEVVERGTKDEVIFSPMHPYSKALMASIVVPEAGSRNHKLQAIPGAPPNLKYEIKGCRFAERCTCAESDCRSRKVEERAVGSRSFRCML